MTDPATIIASARMSWQLLARIPRLAGWMLRLAFPVSKCKTLLVVDMPGSHARLELLRVRPSAALIGVEVTLHNHLPFDVEFEVWRLTMNINSSAVLDAVLNTRHSVPATASARIPLLEISLSDQQADWLRVQSDDCVRAQVGLHWRCKSVIHDWQDHGSYECLVYSNKDQIKGGPQ